MTLDVIVGLNRYGMIELGGPTDGQTDRTNRQMNKLTNRHVEMRGRI